MNDIFLKLKEVFDTFEHYNCFVCSSTNPIGLKLDIKLEEDLAFADFNLSNLYSGFPSIIHGGVQASIIDEIGFWAMFNSTYKLGFTQRIEVDYLSKIGTDIMLRVEGRTLSLEKNVVRVQVNILDHSKIKSQGIVEYKLISDSAIKKFFGAEFFNEFNRRFRND